MKTKRHTAAELRARIERASSLTCAGLRHICEDNHPEVGFDVECAWCQIKLALDLDAERWRAEDLTESQIRRRNA